MSNPVNPYQSPTGACQQDKHIGGNRPPESSTSDAAAWRIMFGIGLVAGYFVWLVINSWFELSAATAWLVQGAAITIGVLPAFILFPPGKQSRADSRLLHAITPPLVSMAIWSLAACAQYFVGAEAGSLTWITLVMLICVWERFNARRKAASDK